MNILYSMESSLKRQAERVMELGDINDAVVVNNTAPGNRNVTEFTNHYRLQYKHN